MFIPGRLLAFISGLHDDYVTSRRVSIKRHYMLIKCTPSLFEDSYAYAICSSPPGGRFPIRRNEWSFGLHDTALRDFSSLRKSVSRAEAGMTRAGITFLVAPCKRKQGHTGEQ